MGRPASVRPGGAAFGLPVAVRSQAAMRLLVISDVQGNLPALDAVLRAASPARPDVVVCLGDVACGPAGAEAIDRLREAGARCVRGNMDEALVDPPASYGDGPDDAAFAAIDRWAAARLTREQHAWLADLPPTLRIDLPGGRTLLACHGSPVSTTDVLGPDTPTAQLRAHTTTHRADVLAVGHLHDPMRRSVDGSLVINPGSVGWPTPRGGRRPREAAYALLDASHSGVETTFARATYDRAALDGLVLASGMPNAAFYLEHWAA